MGSWVHPRGRGGYDVREPVHLGLKGPSPRTRGIPGHLSVAVHLSGSIPADAGDTAAYVRACRMSWVHPRGRGGYYTIVADVGLAAGPSPRTRGIRDGEHAHRITTGSIPADAGDTVVAFSGRGKTRVHPRGRGGYYSYQSGSLPNTGPSPRTRGIPGLVSAAPSERGSIPADAGDTA